MYLGEREKRSACLTSSRMESLERLRCGEKERAKLISIQGEGVLGKPGDASTMHGARMLRAQKREKRENPWIRNEEKEKNRSPARGRRGDRANLGGGEKGGSN